MASLTPEQMQQIRDWAIANGLNPDIQSGDAQRLLQSGVYGSFEELANAAQMKRAQELSSTQVPISPEQIRAWFQQNPGASAADIESAMTQYGISPQQIAVAMGSQAIPNAPSSVQVAQYQNMVGGRNDLTDINRAIEMRRFGVDANELSAATGMPIEQAQALAGRAQDVNPLAGQVTNEQIQAWAAGNPNASPQTVYTMAQQYGISPEQAAQALGMDIGQMQGIFASGMPTGQYGFEQATQRGLADVTGTLRQGQTEARAALDPAIAEVARLYNLNVEDLQAAGTQGRSDLERTYGTAAGYFDPYRQAGTTALQTQMALSGALGPQAFQQAYQESPYIQFLREQGERSTLAGAAATGGLGGGRVQQELVRFGQGLASQGLQQQIQNLQALSGQGLQAAGAGADIQTGLGAGLVNLGTGIAQNVAGQRGALAGEQSLYGQNVANLAMGTATGIANAQQAAAQNIANQRANVAALLSGQVGTAASGLADISAQQGTSLANTTANYGQTGLNMQGSAIAGNIADVSNAAANEAAAQQGYGGQVSGLISGQPFQQQPVIGSGVGQALGAAGMMYDLGNPYTRPTQLPANMPSLGTPNITPQIMSQIPGYGSPALSSGQFGQAQFNTQYLAPSLAGIYQY